MQYTLYNVAGQAATMSVAYFVAAYTGAAGAAAYSIPDSTQLATTATYDGLGRTLRVTDPLSNVTQTAYSIICSAPGTGSDTGCYEQTLGTDANTHRGGTRYSNSTASTAKAFTGQRWECPTASATTRDRWSVPVPAGWDGRRGYRAAVEQHS